MSQGSNNPEAAANAATGRGRSWPSTRPSFTTAPKVLSCPEHQPSSDTWPATARGSSERQTCCPCCAWPDHLGSASGLLASLAVFRCLFFSFRYVFNSLILSGGGLSRGQPATLGARGWDEAFRKAGDGAG